MVPLDEVFIIAEAGVNHNGNLDNAFKLIDLASRAGANAIKFQNYKTEELIQSGLTKETYQIEGDSDSETQFEMLKRFELDRESTRKLMDYADEKKIMFMSTPYDKDSVDLLVNLDLKVLKIGSGEITDLPFLKYVASKKLFVILSTGASTMNEVQDAVDTIYSYHKNLILLHCTSSYPALMRDVNLKAMLSLQKGFDCHIGYSDHTLDNTVSIAAVAMGAKVIERHITLDKNMDGPDHKASLNEREFTTLVNSIRDLEVAFGDGIKRPTDSELETRAMGRRSIVTRISISKGEVITESMLSTKRPGTGMLPYKMFEIIGKRTTQALKEDYLIEPTDVENYDE
jgi:N,N'-diacetyllegionaminate synthase